MELIKCLNRKKYKFYERNFLILNMLAGTCLKSWNGATKGWKSGTPKKNKKQKKLGEHVLPKSQSHWVWKEHLFKFLRTDWLKVQCVKTCIYKLWNYFMSYVTVVQWNSHNILLQKLELLVCWEKWDWERRLKTPWLFSPYVWKGVKGVNSQAFVIKYRVVKRASPYLLLLIKKYKCIFYMFISMLNE